MIYQIVHATVGRYRFRVPKLVDDVELGEQLKSRIASFAFVTEVRLNAAASSLIISYKASAIAPTTALDKFVNCICQVIGVEVTSEETLPEDLKPELNQWQDLGWPSLSLALALLVTPLELPPLIVVLAITGAAFPWLHRATDSLFNQRQASIDLMDWVWMTAQTARGQYVAPALKTVMVEVRRTLRGNHVHTREQDAHTLLNTLEQRVRVERDGHVQHMLATEVQRGDRIIVQTGELILVDGLVLSGGGTLDVQHLTGELLPISCSTGQDVYAPTRLLQGQLHILVQRVGMNTRAGLAAYLTQTAPVRDTRLGAHQAEFLRHAVFPTLMLGGAIYALTGNVGAALSPYQLDFGSGIPISLSTTVLQALVYAAHQGIYIRSGGVLERLAEIDVVVFDHCDQLNSHDQEATETIAILHQQAITTYLITQSPLVETCELAQTLGIHANHTYAEATASQQIHLLQGLQHHGKTVAWVSQQHNSSGCLPHASVSISFAGEHYITCSAADVVMLNPDLRGITHAIAIAKRAMEVVYQNTTMIVAPNLFMQIGAGMIFGWTPISNVIVNNGSAFIAEFLLSSQPLFDSKALPPLRNHIPAVDQPQETAQLSTANGSPLSFIVEENVQTKPTSFCSPLTQSELAQRLGVASQQLTGRRAKPDFTVWAQTHDPEGIAWSYDATARCYLQVSS
jgi:cation transport ATPase